MFTLEINILKQHSLSRLSAGHSGRWVNIFALFFARQISWSFERSTKSLKIYTPITTAIVFSHDEL